MNDSVLATSSMDSPLTSVINSAFLYKLRDRSTKLEVLQWCMDVGLLKKSRECDKCQGVMKLVESKNSSDGYVWRCRTTGDNAHQCRKSVRKGSLFNRSKLSIGDILIITYMWCSRCTTQMIINELNLNSKTVADWIRFCRELCQELCVHWSEKIGGVNTIVEMGAYKIKEKNNIRGEPVRVKVVLVGVERRTDRCFASVANECKDVTLLAVIKKNIAPGTTIYSYCWKKYNCRGNEKFRQLTESHSILFKDPEKKTDISFIEGSWASIRRVVGNDWEGKFDIYLAECVWRRKSKGNNIMNAFIQDAKLIYPLTDE